VRPLLTAPGPSTGILNESQARDPLEVISIASEQRQVMEQSSSGNEAICHTDGLTCAFQMTPNPRGSLSSRKIQRQDIDGLNQFPDLVATLSFVSTGQEFKAGDSRSP
jgi:hypothetical protein